MQLAVFARPFCKLNYFRSEEVQFLQRRTKKLHARTIARLFREQNVVKVASTDKQAQRLYVFGLAEYGALGVDFEEIAARRGAHPRKIVDRPYGLTWFTQHDARVTHIACGFGFTLFAAIEKRTKRHALFGCGLNTDSQIGFQQRSREESARRGNSPIDDYYATPQRIVLPFRNAATRIVALGCGRAHSVVVTDTEGVFTFGNNAYGQCMREIIDSEVYRDSHRINRVDLEFLTASARHESDGTSRPTDERVVAVECGTDQTLLLTSAGRVFASGLGTDGQLASGSFECSAQPLLVHGGDLHTRISQVSARGDTALAVTECGVLLGWGNSEYSQLPSAAVARDELQVARPVRIAVPSDCGRVVQACSAGTACALLNEAGDVFTWGYYAVAAGPNATVIERPTRIPPALFGRTEADPEVRVERLVCGLSHFVAITNRGDAYAWGVNRYGQLGIGTRVHQPFPYRIALPAYVKSVHCGADHTVVLAKTFT